MYIYIYIYMFNHSFLQLKLIQYYILSIIENLKELTHGHRQQCGYCVRDG